MLSSFSLCSTVQSPPRIRNNSTSAIDNTFIDKVNNDKYAICLFINGLSDHNAKIITIHNIIPQNQISYTQTRRKFNIFMINLIYESWDNIFTDDDNTLLIIFLICI